MFYFPSLLLYICRSILFILHLCLSVAVSFFLKSFLYVLFSVSIRLHGRRLFTFTLPFLCSSSRSVFILMCVYLFGPAGLVFVLSVLEIIHLDSALKHRPAAPSSPLFSPPLFHPLILSSSFQSVAFSLSLSPCFMPLPVGFLPHLSLMFEHL